MEVSCTYCFNGTENACSECSDPVCADHADEKNLCLDAEGGIVHKPKPKRKKTETTSVDAS